MSGVKRIAVGPKLDRIRVAVPSTLVWDEIESEVEAAVRGALIRIAKTGVEIVELELPILARIPVLNAAGGIPAAEAYAWHRRLLDGHASEYDPRVRSRIERGAAISAADYATLIRERAAIQAQLTRELAGFSAWAMPTLPRIAPPVQTLESDAAYFNANRLVLRNASLVNFLDGCAITLPCHAAGAAPVGLSLVGARGTDAELLALAGALEHVVRPPAV
jgi:aspartyl-tRNA(Asn)/glutamyl-tRNA(Gln) amidotransferase subunit A